VLVGLVGCALIGVGVVLGARAAMRRFLKQLDTAAMSHRTREVVTGLGVGGGVARGIVFAGVGVFALVAAVRYDPHQAKGMDATLRSFAHTPAGPWLLVAIAAGLILFGGFSFASARWRRL
jgi:NAD/NADP transhydrogenase alpha subunit